LSLSHYSQCLHAINSIGPEANGLKLAQWVWGSGETLLPPLGESE